MVWEGIRPACSCYFGRGRAGDPLLRFGPTAPAAPPTNEKGGDQSGFRCVASPIARGELRGDHVDDVPAPYLPYTARHRPGIDAGRRSRGETVSPPSHGWSAVGHGLKRRTSNRWSTLLGGGNRTPPPFTRSAPSPQTATPRSARHRSPEERRAAALATRHHVSPIWVLALAWTRPLLTP